MGSQKNKAGGNTQNVRPLSPFEFMDKYRVPILAVCAFGLVGFGVWGALVEAFGIGQEGRLDPDEVVASFTVGDQQHEVSRKDLGEIPYPRNLQDSEAVYRFKTANLIQRAMIDDLAVSVSDDEVKRGIGWWRESMSQQLGGKFTKEQYQTYANRGYGSEVSHFEALFRDSMRISKLMRQLDRAADVDVSMDEIYDEYRKLYAKIKLKGVFFSTESFDDAVKLDEDDNGNLTAKSRETLDAWWKALEEKERKAFHKGGALLTTEYMGFRFADRTDEELEAAFKAVNADSGTSLEKLTEAFTPSDVDTAKLIFRFDRFRTEYGLNDEADVDAEYTKREARLVIEWKIWKLLKKIHTDVTKDIADGKKVDFDAVAKANNLSVQRFSKESLENLRGHEEVGGNWAVQLPATKKGTVLNWMVGVGPQSPAHATGPVDETGRFVGIWLLEDVLTDPEPSLDDVLADARESYVTTRGEELRDEAFDAFEGKLDAWLDNKVKDFAKTAGEEAATAIKEETAELDLLKDKDEIERVTKARNDEADARIDEEKGKYRGEAFDAVLPDAGPHAMIVEEGFFLPIDATGELGPDVEKKGNIEEKARHAVRREFRSLQDNVANDIFIDIGTVSKPLVCNSFKSLKGIGKLIAKKEPTVEDMFIRPSHLRNAEQGAMRRVQAASGAAPQTIWDYAAMKSGPFKLQADEIDKQIADEKERIRQRDLKLAERARRRQAKKAEKAKEAADAAMKAFEEAQKAAKEAEDAKDEPIKDDAKSLKPAAKPAVDKPKK